MMSKKSTTFPNRLFAGSSVVTTSPRIGDHAKVRLYRYVQKDHFINQYPSTPINDIGGLLGGGGSLLLSACRACLDSSIGALLTF